MSELREDLNATADSVIKDAEQLIEVERRKQDATTTSDADALGDEAVRLADTLTRKVRAEADITHGMTQRKS
jgi:hypothetical protein